jgi:hypothetical protein
VAVVAFAVVAVVVAVAAAAAVVVSVQQDGVACADLVADAEEQERGLFSEEYDLQVDYVTAHYLMH